MPLFNPPEDYLKSAHLGADYINRLWRDWCPRNSDINMKDPWCLTESYDAMSTSRLRRAQKERYDDALMRYIAFHYHFPSEDNCPVTYCPNQYTHKIIWLGVHMRPVSNTAAILLRTASLNRTAAGWDPTYADPVPQTTKDDLTKVWTREYVSKDGSTLFE